MVGKRLEEIIEEVRKDFSFLEGRVLGVVIFGSWAKGEVGRDIDICIVAPNRDAKEVLREVYRTEMLMSLERSTTSMFLKRSRSF